MQMSSQGQPRVVVASPPTFYYTLARFSSDPSSNESVGALASWAKGGERERTRKRRRDHDAKPALFSSPPPFFFS